MTRLLDANRIPVEKIEVNPNKIQPITGKISALLAGDKALKETVSGRRFLKDFGHAQNNKLRQFALFRGMELQLWQHNMAFFYDGKGKWEQLL